MFLLPVLFLFHLLVSLPGNAAPETIRRYFSDLDDQTLIYKNTPASTPFEFCCGTARHLLVEISGSQPGLVAITHGILYQSRFCYHGNTQMNFAFYNMTFIGSIFSVTGNILSSSAAAVAVSAVNFVNMNFLSESVFSLSGNQLEIKGTADQPVLQLSTMTFDERSRCLVADNSIRNNYEIVRNRLVAIVKVTVQNLSSLVFRNNTLFAKAPVFQSGGQMQAWALYFVEAQFINTSSVLIEGNSIEAIARHPSGIYFYNVNFQDVQLLKIVSNTVSTPGFQWVSAVHFQSCRINVAIFRFARNIIHVESNDDGKAFVMSSVPRRIDVVYFAHNAITIKRLSTPCCNKAGGEGIRFSSFNYTVRKIYLQYNNVTAVTESTNTAVVLAQMRPETLVVEGNIFTLAGVGSTGLNFIMPDFNSTTIHHYQCNKAQTNTGQSAQLATGGALAAIIAQNTVPGPCAACNYSTQCIFPPLSSSSLSFMGSTTATEGQCACPRCLNETFGGPDCVPVPVALEEAINWTSCKVDCTDSSSTVQTERDICWKVVSLWKPPPTSTVSHTWTITSSPTISASHSKTSTLLPTASPSRIRTVTALSTFSRVPTRTITTMPTTLAPTFAPTFVPTAIPLTPKPTNATTTPPPPVATALPLSPLDSIGIAPATAAAISASVGASGAATGMVSASAGAKVSSLQRMSGLALCQTGLEGPEESEDWLNWSSLIGIFPLYDSDEVPQEKEQRKEEAAVAKGGGLNIDGSSANVTQESSREMILSKAAGACVVTSSILWVLFVGALILPDSINFTVRLWYGTIFAFVLFYFGPNVTGAGVTLMLHSATHTGRIVGYISLGLMVLLHGALSFFIGFGFDSHLHQMVQGKIVKDASKFLKKKKNNKKSTRPGADDGSSSSDDNSSSDVSDLDKKDVGRFVNDTAIGLVAPILSQRHFLNSFVAKVQYTLSAFWNPANEFTRSSQRMVCMIEALTAHCIAVVGGIRPNEIPKCQAVAITMSILALGQTGYLVVVRPFGRMIELVFSVLLWLSVVVVGIFSFLVLQDPQRFPLLGYGQLAANGIVYTQMVLLVGSSIYDYFHRRKMEKENKKNLEAYAKRTKKRKNKANLTAPDDPKRRKNQKNEDSEDPEYSGGAEDNEYDSVDGIAYQDYTKSGRNRAKEPFVYRKWEKDETPLLLQAFSKKSDQDYFVNFLSNPPPSSSRKINREGVQSSTLAQVENSSVFLSVPLSPPRNVSSPPRSQSPEALAAAARLQSSLQGATRHSRKKRAQNPFDTL